MRQVIVCSSNCDEPTEYKIPIFRLTLAGGELLKLLISIQNKGYVLDCYRDIKANNPKLKITAHNIIQTLPDGNIKHDDEDLL